MQYIVSNAGTQYTHQGIRTPRSERLVVSLEACFTNALARVIRHRNIGRWVVVVQHGGRNDHLSANQLRSRDITLPDSAVSI